MESKEKILDLIVRLSVLPVGNDVLLQEFLTDLKYNIQDIFAEESQYLDYLKYIKFQSDVVFVTEKERERSWLDGSAQVDNLLRVILNDPKVNGQGILSPGIQLNQSSQDFESELEETVQQSLGNLKNEIIAEHSQLQKRSIVIDAEQNTSASDLLLSHLGVQNVLCVTGNDERLQEEVTGFLKKLPMNIVTIPKVVGQESLMDRMNRCLDVDFVIFVLSPDFHIYSRSQSPVDASLAASQEVVFQLGYLAAKFDRQKIVVLYQEDPDFLRPTEFFDLFYIPITQADTWKNEVLRRMKGKLAIPAGLGLSFENQSVV